MGGVLLCSSVCQAFGGPASLMFSCWYFRVERERLWWWLHLLRVTHLYDFHGCLALFHWHFQPRSSPLHPLYPSLHSQQQPSPWDCSTIPKLQFPVTAASGRPLFLPRVWMTVARTVWFSFHLGCHRSTVSLSALNVSLLTQTIAPLWGLDPCCSVPPTAEGRSSPRISPP